MPDIYGTLPAELALTLLSSATGRDHLLRAANLALRHAVQDAGAAARLLPLARQLFTAALEADPLNAAAASMLLHLHARQPFLDNKQAADLHALGERCTAPGDTRYLQRLAAGGDREKLRRYLETQAGKAPENLYWRQHLLSLSLSEGDYGRTKAVLASQAFRAIPLLSARLRADLHFLEGRPEKAEEGYAFAQASFPWVQAGFKAALARKKTGDTGRAAEMFAEVARLHPWHTNARLLAHECARPQATPARLPEGKIFICLYTYNKAEEIDQALAALAQSDLGEAKIVALANGCTDATGEVLSRWREELGSGRLEVIDLPINVGAPAARNWLADHALRQGADWVAFLDDDALVPENWLHEFSASIAACPDAGVYGCKVTDVANPHRLQSVDLHLLPPEEADGWRRFTLSDAHLHELDFGQFAYIRPCASATGCCHLFPAQSLKETGGFDIRYTPSQFDDLDHDLRLCLKGRLPVYNGRLRVRHMKNTGYLSTLSGEHRSGYANQVKLHAKFSPEEVQDIIQRDLNAMLEDLRTKSANR